MAAKALAKAKRVQEQWVSWAKRKASSESWEDFVDGVEDCTKGCFEATKGWYQKVPEVAETKKPPSNAVVAPALAA